MKELHDEKDKVIEEKKGIAEKEIEKEEFQKKKNAEKREIQEEIEKMEIMIN